MTGIRDDRETRWAAFLDGLSFVILTILVWGVNALQRGMWQDDAQALGAALKRLHEPFPKLFSPFVTPLRRLTILPSALAYVTPHPVWTLQFLCAAIWLAHGVLAGWIVSLLLPGRRWTRFAVVCLTLTATSDFTSGSMLTLGYNFAALQVLAAAGLALRWLQRGRIVALVASSVLLACSLLTMDVALPAIPFLGLLFLLAGGWSPGRRVIALAAGWGIVLVPIGVAEWSFLHDPKSYAAVALVPMPKAILIQRAFSLWKDNFEPWHWAFARPQWYARPPHVIGFVWMAVGSLAAACVFLLRLRTKRSDARSTDGRREIYLAALFGAMALAANFVYARVSFSVIHYRTHILSRVWASLAIGIVAGWVVTNRPRLRWVAVGVVTAFVFFGTWGGIERQDFFLSSWRGHQRELASILDSAPSLRPGTSVILRSTDTSGRYLATEADYLTRHWLMLLYDDARLQALRLNPKRGSGCNPVAGGLECWRDGQAACFASKTCQPARFRFETLVVMEYEPRTGTYYLVHSLRGDPFALGFESDAERYHPENRIIQRPWTLRQRRLLLTEE